MKVSTTKTVLLITILIATSSCRSLSISMNDTNPPVFSFSAGEFAECCTHLAFLAVKEVLPNKADEKVIWQIFPLSGTDNSAEHLPHITYGQVPVGFEQKIPA